MAAAVTLCVLCTQKIGLNTSALVCSGPCKGKFHLTCTTVSKLNYKEVKNKGSFCCKSCSNSKFIHGDEDENIMENDDQSKRLEERSTDGDSRHKLSMEENIDQMFNEFLDLKKFCVFMANKIDDYEEDRKKINSLQDKVNNLQKENKELKQKMVTISLKVAEKEQQEFADTCIVYGTTRDKGREEDLPSLVCEFAHKIYYKIKQEDIIKCTRFNSQDPNMSSSIVVKCKSPEVQQALIKASKQAFKEGRPVTSKALNVPWQNRHIFINPYMTAEMRYMFNQARRLHKECGYKFVWFANNKVYIKKHEEDRPQVIKSPQ
jgi:hypothetical protein